MNDALQRVMARCVLDAATGCQLWTGWHDSLGYPCARRRVDGKKTTVRLRRWVLTQRGIYVPPGVPVIDSCGSKACLNPNHIRLGQLKEKAVAICRAGTRSNARFTAEQVLRIRSRKRSGETYPALASEFGVSWGAMRDLVLGYTYAWVEDQPA